MATRQPERRHFLTLNSKEQTMAKDNSTSSGIGIGGLLLVAFVVLKLCKVIDWSWWWVLSPIWIPLCLVLFGLFVFVIYKMASSKY